MTRAMSGEPFGPLVPVNPVRNLDGTIKKADSRPYGLAGHICQVGRDRLKPAPATSCTMDSKHCRRSTAFHIAQYANPAYPELCASVPHLHSAGA